MQPWLIYGATGYTGRMIAQQAARQGLRPVLAGRGDNVRPLAESLGLPARTFDLADARATRAGLDGMALVLNCAGPFSATAAPMIEACLAAGVHYLDITGEIAVFEYAHAQSDAAHAKGIVLCPGVGFDVVPTDCLAAALKEALPDATSLSLGFDTRSPMSPGTTKTMIEGLPGGGKVRRDGRIVDVPLAFSVRRIDFGFGEKTAVTIPWGDVSTAYYSTGIPNIDCYLAVPGRAARHMKLMNGIRPLLRLRVVQAFLKRRVERNARGPDDAQRAKLRTAVWGEARNERGDVRVGRLTTANGYALTVDSALALTRHLFEHPPAAGGHYTPSRLCGWRFVETLPGSGTLQIA
jgi:short subunit dehydrogenase-like uncharacterized protein